MAATGLVSPDPVEAVFSMPVPCAMACEEAAISSAASASARRFASSGSEAYKSVMRCSVSSSSAASFDGDHDVLAVEVRALAIGTGHRVKHDQLARCEALVQELTARVQSERIGQR